MPSSQEKLQEIITLLLTRNEHVNLTATRDFESAWNKHIEDSLQANHLDLLKEAASVIDIGTGPGLPGLPLAITNPHLQTTFLEATGKKCDFIREMIEHFNLSATVINDRAEQVAHDSNYREKYDLALTRAVGSFPEVLELSLPFLKVTGHAILWRGELANTEPLEHAKTLATLKAEVATIIPYTLPNSDQQYHLTIVKKLQKTPSQFPRTTGTPKKHPLS